MSQMTLTIETNDTKVVREAAEMLLRLSGSAESAFGSSISRLDSHIGDAGVMTPPFCAEASSVASADLNIPREVNVVDATAFMQAVNDNNVATLDEQLEMDVVCGCVDPSQAFGGTCQSMQDTIDSENAIGDGREATPPPPPPPPATTTVELDSEGMPWDARIHTKERTKIANGTWKLARNTPKELVASVKAEYLGNAVQSPTTNNATTVEQPVVPITDVPPPPPPPQQPSTAPSVDPVRQFMSDIAKSGKMPLEINTALQRHGVQTLQLIRDNADKIPAIRLELGL